MTMPPPLGEEADQKNAKPAMSKPLVPFQLQSSHNFLSRIKWHQATAKLRASCIIMFCCRHMLSGRHPARPSQPAGLQIKARLWAIRPGFTAWQGHVRSWLVLRH